MHLRFSVVGLLLAAPPAPGAERAETLVHGLAQAFQKRGLPRAALMDNGAPMLAAETREGLLRLGVHQDTTLPYSPYQNAKQEVFWAQAEGRLLAMLEGVVELTLPLLNEATQAEIPDRYRQLTRVTVRYASWDLGHVTLIDEPTGAPLSPLYPLDRAKNADGRRRPRQPVVPDATPAEPPPSGIAPLLRKLMAEYAATSLPPAYLPTEDA